MFRAVESGCYIPRLSLLFVWNLSVDMFLGRAWLTARSGCLKPVLLLSSASVAATTYYFLSDRADILPLNPSRFTPTTLIESEDVASNTKLLTLSVPPELLPHDPGAFAPIWSIFIKDSDIQVERPYTPLEGIDENGHMKFWVKKYERGEVGRWLHSRQVGDSIEIRGPVKTWPRLWQDGHWDEVVLACTSILFSSVNQLTTFPLQDLRWNRNHTFLPASTYCFQNTRHPFQRSFYIAPCIWIVSGPSSFEHDAISRDTLSEISGQVPITSFCRVHE